jgi:uncharacterized membrane protein
MNFSLLKWKFEISRQTLLFIFLILIFAVVASLQSIAAHTHYFSNNADLGFHNQLMWKFAHFKRPSTTLWGDGSQLNNCFGDHMTLLMPLNSQLYWIFGSSALLVAQIGYCIFGSIGIYKLVVEKTANYSLALGAVLLFFSHYSLYAALTFDAHDNVYGMMFLPWMFYFFFKDNLKWFLICLGIFLMAREDLALTSMFAGITLLMLDWKKKKVFGILCIVISLVYFLITYKFIIPKLSPVDGNYTAWRFISLGNSISEVLMNFVTHPKKIWGLMTNNDEKIEKLTFFLLTGGALLIFKPKYIFIFLPTLGTTLFSDNWELWGNYGHYNIIFAVMLPVVIAFTLSKIKIDGLTNLTLQIFTGMTFYTLGFVYLQRWTKFDRIFTKNYYEYRSNRSEIKKAIKLIPDGASVSTTNHLTPHIAFRDQAYMYPIINNADYILINEEDKLYLHYPYITADDFNVAMKTIYADSSYKIVFNEKHVVLFKRISSKQ